MRTPRFVPLVCPGCAGGLAGHAEDLAVFCPRCGSAFLAGEDDPAPLRTRHVTAAPPADGTRLALPFWTDGTLAVPAFLSVRPLSLARAATLLLPSWPLADGFGAVPPLGATLEPSALAAIARLTGLAAAPADAAPSRELALLAVPAAFVGGRYRLPGFAFELVPDDVQVVSAAARA